MENKNQTPHKRRVHYKGKYPKKFEEKYKRVEKANGLILVSYCPVHFCGAGSSNSCIK